MTDDYEKQHQAQDWSVMAKTETLSDTVLADQVQFAHEINCAVI